MTLKATSGFAILACVIGTAAQADQVIADDLIVGKTSNGLICVGSECADGEDTIDPFAGVLELSDNRTMIHFDDTSDPDFPDADWVLRANDTDEFGENRFMLQTLNNTPLKNDRICARRCVSKFAFCLVNRKRRIGHIDA